jgi:hypothetical protein
MMGVTPENRHAMKGIFRLYSSQLGIPLSDVIDFLWEQGRVVDWGDFYHEARLNGMSLEQTKRLMKGGFQDSFHCQAGLSNVETFFRAIKKP